MVSGLPSAKGYRDRDWETRSDLDSFSRTNAAIACITVYLEKPASQVDADDAVPP